MKDGRKEGIKKQSANQSINQSTNQSMNQEMAIYYVHNAAHRVRSKTALSIMSRQSMHESGIIYLALKRHR